jgi:EmrB/QacA subfamily drug resistance transporter
MTLNTARPIASEPPPAAGDPRRRAVYALMPACAILAVSLVAAINLAIPKLSASSLHPSASQLLWIVDIYVLVFGCLLIPAGALGDRYGRKGALLTGLAIVAVGCLLTAAAPGVPLLLCGRALTGIGAALVMPATLSLMMQVTAPDRRPEAVAVWTAATGIAGIVGNFGGGLILEYLPWEGLFLAVAPIAVVLAVLAAIFTPRGERHPADLDVAGSALLVATVAALLYGIIEGPSLGWTSAPVLGALALSALLLAGFTAYAVRTAHPLLDPRIFRSPQLRAGSLGVGLAFFGLFALFFVNAQYLQYAKGFSPLLTGLAIGPLAVGMMLISRRSIGWATRFGTRRMVAAGLLTLAAGLALLSLADASTPYAAYAGFLVVMSAGMGLCVPSLSAAVMTSLPHNRAGMGSGLNGATREIGSALGVAVFGTILSSRFASSLHGSTVAGIGRKDSPAAALATAGRAGHAQVVTAFTDAMSVGYRVMCVGVLILTPVILHWLRPSANR